MRETSASATSSTVPDEVSISTWLSTHAAYSARLLPVLPRLLGRHERTLDPCRGSSLLLTATPRSSSRRRADQRPRSGGPLRDLQRRDLGELVPKCTTLEPQLVIRLQVHPELLGGPEVPRQTDRRVSR